MRTTFTYSSARGISGADVAAPPDGNLDVIAIIAILIGLLLPAVQKVRSRAGGARTHLFYDPKSMQLRGIAGGTPVSLAAVDAGLYGEGGSLSFEPNKPVPLGLYDVQAIPGASLLLVHGPAGSGLLTPHFPPLTSVESSASRLLDFGIRFWDGPGYEALVGAANSDPAGGILEVL